jgi:hypothetical protein
MRIRLSLLVAAVMTLLAVGVSAAAVNRGLPAHVTWFDAPDHETGTDVPSAFVVQQRGYYSITAQMHLKELTPGHRYTLWWVAYNDPSACTDGCGMDELAAAANGDNPAGIGVYYGGSYVVTKTGKVDVGTRILEFSVNGCQTDGPYAICDVLRDASVAEAMILINDQGPATGAPLAPAAEAFSDGCKSYSQGGVVVATFGDTGFDCFTAQTVFLP